MPRYFAPVAGHVVSRYGTGTRTKNNQPIGHTRGKRGAFELIAKDIVVLIPDAEAQRYAREYDRAVADGALKELDEAAYKAWLAAEVERGKVEAEKAAKAQPAAEAAEVEAEKAPQG